MASSLRAPPRGSDWKSTAFLPDLPSVDFGMMASMKCAVCDKESIAEKFGTMCGAWRFADVEQQVSAGQNDAQRAELEWTLFLQAIEEFEQITEETHPGWDRMWPPHPMPDSPRPASFTDRRHLPQLLPRSFI